jgi:hypothetical protein
MTTHCDEIALAGHKKDASANAGFGVPVLESKVVEPESVAGSDGKLTPFTFLRGLWEGMFNAVST